MARQHLSGLTEEGITHVIANIGMWFGTVSGEQYTDLANNVLSSIVDLLGVGVHITWMSTPAVVPAIHCYDDMKRHYLRNHTDYANAAIDKIRSQHPTLKVRLVDAFSITDSRPDSSSDGR